jgi:hypothetical protein
MSYFSNLPFTAYEFNGVVDAIKDITVRSKFFTEYKDYTDLYSLYEISDGETPESLAYDYYKSPEFYWVILIYNELHNIEFEWPLSVNQLNLYCQNKYGEYANTIKHWVNQDDLVSGEIKEFVSPWVPPVNPGVEGNLEYVPVTFYEYEEKLNDEKRIIKLLRIELLTEFVTQFKNSLSYVRS